MKTPISIGELKTCVQQWQSEGKKVVFTNGVFDILHLGHVTYLEKAKQIGDKLVVGVNDDASVKKLEKGAERPINPEHARACVIGALASVDATIIFSDDTPLEIIRTIMPDILVKGGDYDPMETDASKKTFIVGSKEVKENGGQVISIDLVPNYSTTSIVKKMRK